MKKFLGIALALMMFGCDFGTESKKEVPIPIPKDTTKTIIRKTIVQKDTNINVSYSMNISGKVSEKNSDGNTIGGFSAIVCLENSGKCTKTNSKGQYSFNTPKTSMIAGRMFAESDTTHTPEVIEVPTDIPDTVTTIDTTIVQDTIIRNDSVIIVDSLDIVETINIDGDTTNTDTAIVYKDSKILYEIPVNSWKEILPENYIVQRNIQIEIEDITFLNNMKYAEFVYWKDGSPIWVIKLGSGGSKGIYSGFLYTLYDDSSFANDIENKNVYARLVDSNNIIYAATFISKFSEKSGSITFKNLDIDFIPQIPKDTIFYLQDNDDVVTIQDTTSRSHIDSIFSIHAFSKVYSTDTFSTSLSSKIEYVFHESTNDFWNSNLIDSVYIKFNSKTFDTISIFKITKPVFYDSNYIGNQQMKPDFYFHQAIIVAPGENVISFQWTNDFILNDEKGNPKFYISLSGVLLENIDVTVIFKKP